MGATTKQQTDRPLVPPRQWLLVALLVFVLPAAVLFGSAGTLRWPMAWLYIGLSVIGFAASRTIAWRIHPDLLAERGRMLNHDDAASFDRVLSPIVGLFGTLGVNVVAGLALRFGWTPVFPGWAEWTGVGLYLLSLAVGTWALATNRFFSGVVRIQTERGHHVVTDGPYAIVRHPGYAGALVGYLGGTLMLGSMWALIPLVALMAALVVRTALEDRLLQAELPGYKEYSQQTRFRLIPGIW